MMILLRLNNKYNRDDVMSLRQKAEKIKEIKQGMRKAALVGLASLVTTTALGEENKNNFGGDAKKIKLKSRQFLRQKSLPRVPAMSII